MPEDAEEAEEEEEADASGMLEGERSNGSVGGGMVILRALPAVSGLIGFAAANESRCRMDLGPAVESSSNRTVVS